MGQVCGLHETRSLGRYHPGRNNATNMARFKRSALPQDSQMLQPCRDQKDIHGKSTLSPNPSILTKG